MCKTFTFFKKRIWGYPDHNTAPPRFLVCFLERKERSTTARRMLGVVHTVSVPVGVSPSGHHPSSRSWQKRDWEPSIPGLQEGPSEAIPFLKTLIFVKSSREKSPTLRCQTTLGERKFFLSLNFNKPILFVLLATEKKWPSSSMQQLFWSLCPMLMLLKSPRSFSLLG